MVIGLLSLPPANSKISPLLAILISAERSFNCPDAGDSERRKRILDEEADYCWHYGHRLSQQQCLRKG